MAELKLEWRPYDRRCMEANFYGLELSAWDAGYWCVELDKVTTKEGYVDTWLEAQLAAESAALAWLTEGVTALGGRVLGAGEVALCVEALRCWGSKLDGTDRNFMDGAGDRMQALVKKLERDDG